MSTLVHTADTTFFAKAPASNKIVFDNTDEGAGASLTKTILFTKQGPAINFGLSTVIRIFMHIEIRCTDLLLPDAVSNSEEVVMILKDGNTNTLQLQQTISTPAAGFSTTEWDLAAFTGSGDLSDIVEFTLQLLAECASTPNYLGMVATWNIDEIESSE